MAVVRGRARGSRGTGFRYVGLAVAVSILAGLGLANAPAAAAALPQCPPDSLSPTVPVVGSDQRCINGTLKYTRGFVKPPCLTAVQRPNYVIPRGSCSDGSRRQAERIAQARFIQYLGSSLQPELAPNVAPHIQWEVHTPRFDGRQGRADVVRYLPNGGDPATNPVEVWEIKGDWNLGEDAGEQASEYVQTFQTDAGWGGATLGVAPGYEDYFEVTDYAQCTDGRRVNGRFSVYAGLPGEIRVSELLPECTEQEQDNGSENENEEEESEPDDVPEPLPPLPTPTPTPTPEEEPESVRPGITEVLVTVGVTAVAAKALWEILAARSTAVCVGLSAPPAPRYTSPGPVGGACLTAERVALEAIEQGLSRELAWKRMMDDLLEAIARVEPASARQAYVQALADALGISLVEASELVMTSRARASGDPHVITLDGLNYDLQAVGEFVLADVPGGPHIQTRFVATTPDLSAVNRLAFLWGETVVELRPDGSVLFDGVNTPLTDGAAYLTGGGGYLVRQDGRILVQWPAPEGERRGTALTWEPRSGIGFVGLSVPPSVAGEVSGLLGDFDGDPLDDLKLRNGTQLAANSAPTVLHDAYADSWRLARGESLFTYASGESTQTYTNRAFPRSIVTRGDFSAEQRANAMTTCQTFGVAAGPAFDDCELDVMATGNWAFAATAAKVRVPSVVAGDAVLDESGFVGESFEGDIPNNFDAIRLGEETALGAFAGPFSGNEQYRFYVPQLPGHDSVSLTFDAIALGQWGAADGIRLRVDDAAVELPLDWSDAESGTLESGTPFRRLPVTVSVPHHLSQFAATLSGHGLSSAVGEGFAIDNVAVSLNLVPAQRFATELITDVPVALDGRLGVDGAGFLESRGAVDRYEFTVPEGAEIYLDWQTSSRSLAWSLASADGTVLRWGVAADGDARVGDLTGAYALEVRAAGSQPPITQSYSLAAVLVGPAQVFEVDLGAGPVEVSNGKPGVGAGNLETKASVDEYVFTVGEGGSRVLAEFQPVGNSWNGSWSVLDGQGQVVKAGVLSSSAQWRFDQELAAGEYRLRMASQNERFGTYALRLYVPPAVQEFDLSVGASAPAVFGNASPGVGAGSLETWVSRDVYSFSVPAGSEVFLDTVNTSGYVLWQVVDAQGAVVGSGKFNADARISGLAGGDYELVTWIDPAPVGVNSATYAGSLLLVPAV